jgi:ABC-type sugar transport system ATPase subunit
MKVVSVLVYASSGSCGKATGLNLQAGLRFAAIKRILIGGY